MARKHIRKHVKNHARKLKKRIDPQRIAVIKFFKFLYLTGLTFLLLFIFTTQRPEQIAVFKATPIIVLFISIFFIIYSIKELYMLLGTWKRTCKRLAIFTLIPGVLGILLALFGENIFFRNIPSQIAADYIKKIVPKVWILTIGYIIVGVFLYVLSKKLK